MYLYDTDLGQNGLLGSNAAAVAILFYSIIVINIIKVVQFFI